MTADDILKMEPSLELDACVAELVYKYHITWLNTGLGFYPFIQDMSAEENSSRLTGLIGGQWVKGITRTGESTEIYGMITPKFSEEMSVAWELENELNRRGWRLHLHRYQNGFNCYFHQPDKLATTIASFSTTAPAAISKAAILAALEIVARTEGT